VTEAARQKSTRSRRLTLLLPLVTGTRRHRPAKDHRRQATRLSEVFLAAPFQLAALSGSRTRRIPGQATRAMDYLPGAVGRVTSLHKEAPTAPGHGLTIVSQDKGPLGLSPRRWEQDGRHARVDHDSHRHSQEVNGCQGKGAHVFVPRPRAMQATRGLVGDHHQMIALARRQFSSSIRLDDGARVQLVSSPQLLPTRRHPVVVDATSATSQATTPTFMGQAPCLRRHHRPWDASSAANEDVTLHAMRQVTSHRRRAFQASQQAQLRDQP